QWSRLALRLGDGRGRKVSCRRRRLGSWWTDDLFQEIASGSNECRLARIISDGSHEKRAGDTLRAPVVADGLRHGEDVRLGERSAKRRASSAGAEADELIWAAQVRLPL